MHVLMVLAIAILRVFDDAKVALVSVSWHPSGQKIAASGANGTIWIWNIDGTLLKTIKAHTAPVWDIKFSLDGQRLASTSNDKTVTLWTADGTLVKTLEGHSAAVWQIAFSPDGSLINLLSVWVKHVVNKFVAIYSNR
ncbi:hypothetical protein H6G89_03850 [Oscillatoria sp. FACHB-1407]|uniref:WD40 repeat domain-containing protein n=1 Tax=Oscillatoria sp. FACHB-1407 TaxID=2692847 RepID=UPI0016864EF2|nr:hypothetical protein [Oscillatoria sp. FACHB-1407]MBD2460171.1 hypothetical protein [Oscillatoria sp. FACHB-1407]